MFLRRYHSISSQGLILVWVGLAVLAIALLATRIIKDPEKKKCVFKAGFVIALLCFIISRLMNWMCKK